MPPAPDRVEIDLNELARAAGFPEKFDLAVNAQNAIDAFQQARQIELLDRAIRDQRSTLGHLATSASAAIRDIQALSPDVRLAVLETAVPGLSPEVFRDMPTHLNRLADAASNLFDSVSVGAKGRRAEAGLQFAIKEMYSIFHDHFPDEKGYFRKDEAEYGYEGRFYHLVRLLVAELGIEMSPAGIGKAIERSLKGYEY